MSKKQILVISRSIIICLTISTFLLCPRVISLLKWTKTRVQAQVVHLRLNCKLFQIRRPKMYWKMYFQTMMDLMIWSKFLTFLNNIRTMLLLDRRNPHESVTSSICKYMPRYYYKLQHFPNTVNSSIFWFLETKLLVYHINENITLTKLLKKVSPVILILIRTC